MAAPSALDGGIKEARFSAAADRVGGAVGGGGAALSSAHKLQLYGLYKQALEGRCCSARPPFWDPQGRAKWCGPLLAYPPLRVPTPSPVTWPWLVPYFRRSIH